MNRRRSSPPGNLDRWDNRPRDDNGGRRSRALVTSEDYSAEGILLRSKAAGAFSSCVRAVRRTAVIALIIVAVGFGALHARLAHSPISLTFVVPPIERAVNTTLGNMRFDIGDAVLRRSPTHMLGIEFRLAGVRLLDENNKSVAESPFASGGFSLAALLSGRLAASHIELIGPKLYVHYSDDRGVALSFSDPDSSRPIPTKSQAQLPSLNDAESGNKPETLSTAQSAGLIREARGRAVNLTKALADIFDKSRRGESAFLNSFGIEDALVYFDHDGQITQWQVEAVEVDMSHRSTRSEVTGSVAVNAPSGEVFKVNFGARQNRGTGQISLDLAVDDIVPRKLADDFQSLRLPKMWDMPVSFSASMDLGENGDILNGTILGKLKGGNFYAPWEQVHPAAIDQGDIHLTYSREEGLIKLVKSELRWEDSRLAISGYLKRQPQTGQWAFNFSADELILGAEIFGLPTIPLDHMAAEGSYDPKVGAITLDRFFVQAADAYIALAGKLVHGERSPAIRVAGQVSAMPIAFFKLLWPKFVAHDAREWVGFRMPSGRIAGGTLNVDIPANTLADLGKGGSIPQDALDFQLDMRDIELHYIADLPPMAIDQATMRVAGQRFFFNAPRAEVVSPSGEIINLTDGQFIIGDLRPFLPDGEIHFKSEASAKAVLSLLDHPKLGYISKLDMPVPDVDARSSSTFSLSMKLRKNLKFKNIRLNGRTSLENVRATNLPGGVGVHGGSLKFDVSSQGIDSQGELSVNGIPVLVAWQYLFDTPQGKQPPLRLRTVLDANARREMQLSLDHLWRGPAPAEILVSFRDDAPPKLSFEFNLKETDITATSVGWRKPPGVAGSLSFDLERLENGEGELRNILLRGDDFNVSGALRIDPDKRPVAFNFPTVVLNARTQMQIQGEFAAGNVWKVQVRGASYDGRQFFRSLFSAGKLAENQPQIPEGSPGFDVDVELDKVIGFFNTTLNSVKMTGSRRLNKLQSLDVYGQLNGTRPFAARLEPKPGQPRILLAEATDAGAAFRLMGFYPSARGGEASLSVNLDASDGTQTSGTLFARNFAILNDEVVDEVLSRPQQGRQQVQGQQLQFDRMQIPFSVGGGRFFVKDALINGPLLGATLRGSIDFNNENINLGGTYIPLYGINGALGFVPILGDLLISRSGEGLFGITFAVKGKTSKPDVLVNPMSVVAPGFLRQLFEFNQNQPPQIGTQQPQRQGGNGRSSSLPPRTQ